MKLQISEGCTDIRYNLFHIFSSCLSMKSLCDKLSFSHVHLSFDLASDEILTVIGILSPLEGLPLPFLFPPFIFPSLLEVLV